MATTTRAGLPAKHAALQRAWSWGVAVLALLVSACASPIYEYEDCVTFARGCEIVDAEAYCAQIDAQLVSYRCDGAAEAAWACTVHVGCDFPLQCRAAVAELYDCE